MRLGLKRNELLDFGRQLGDVHAAIELLPLGHELHDDVADFGAGDVELCQAVFRLSLLCFDQQLDDGVHIGSHQAANVSALCDRIL
jgi:hypothetical protein